MPESAENVRTGKESANIATRSSSSAFSLEAIKEET
jgi:hypothetical protein